MPAYTASLPSRYQEFRALIGGRSLASFLDVIHERHAPKFRTLIGHSNDIAKAQRRRKPILNSPQLFPGSAVGYRNGVGESFTSKKLLRNYIADRIRF